MSYRAIYDMKKQQNPLSQFQTHIPSQGELRARTLRRKKDAQTFGWLMGTKQGQGLVSLSRQILGLPLEGLQPSEGNFLHLQDIRNYPKNSDYPLFNQKKLYGLVNTILHSRSLPERFRDSVESLIIFGRPLADLPPSVNASIVISNFNKQKKELWIQIYPDATFKDDLRAYWHSVVMLQQQLEAEKHSAQWKIFSLAENNRTFSDKTIYIRVYKDTVLDDLNNSIFKKELATTFKKAGLQKSRFRKWDYKKAIKFLELEVGKDSDWDKAEKLYGDEQKRNSIKKLRQKIRRKI